MIWIVNVFQILSISDRMNLYIKVEWFQRCEFFPVIWSDRKKDIYKGPLCMRTGELQNLLINVTWLTTNLFGKEPSVLYVSVAKSRFTP